MKALHWFFLLFFLFLLGFLNFPEQKSFRYSFSEEAQLGEVSLSLAIIQKREDLIRGFSFHEQIEQNQGLLFVFGSSQPHGIWMKDMKFALDIIWFNENKEVVSIREDFLPETYPEIAYPGGNSSFVLEVRSGFVRSNKIKVGDRLKIVRDDPQKPLVEPL